MIFYIIIFYLQKMGWYAQKATFKDWLKIMTESSEEWYCFRVNTKEFDKIILSIPIPQFYQAKCIYNYYYPNSEENTIVIPFSEFHRRRLLKI